MKKKILSVLLVMSVAIAFVSCGGSQENSSVSTIDDQNVYAGTFFTVGRLEGAQFTQTGNDFSRSNDNGLISIKTISLPGIMPADVEKTRDVLDGFSDGMIDISVNPIKVDGRDALAMVGKKNDITFKYVALPLTDAVCLISNEPITKDNESDFEKVLGSFKVINQDFFKGYIGKESENVPGGSKNNPPQSPMQSYKDESFSFSVPQEWEITSSNKGSCLITPVDTSSPNVMQGISIDIVPKHNRESDLAYAQSSGSKATTVTYGSNTFAQFYIASINTYNFIMSKNDKTCMITVTSNSDQISEKVKEFLKTLVIK